MFNDSLIGYLEMVTEQVGLAVQSSLIHTKLKEAHTELDILARELQKKNTELRTQLKSAGLTPVVNDPLKRTED